MFEISRGEAYFIFLEAERINGGKRTY